MSFGGDDLREHGLQVATRLIAVVRMGRSYAIGNPVFTSQLEQLLEVLAPVLAECGEARIADVGGDLHLNDVAVPARPASVRFTEQLLQEFSVRGIAGLRFTPGLQLRELELFMGYFLPSEIYKASDLEQACVSQGFSHVAPLLWLPVIPEAELAPRVVPPAYQLGATTWAAAMRDARALLEDGLPPGVASHHYKRVVRPLVDAALAGDALTVGLADLDETGSGHWLHGLRIAVLAILVGRALGLERATLAELGAAALVHGTAGYDESAPDADTEPGPLAATLVPRAHVAPLDPVTLVVLRAALPPTGKAGTGASPLADIVRLAEAWVTLAARRDGGVPRWTPSEALGGVLGPLGSLFHPALRLALVQSLGVHPPGQMVELDDGTVARVAAADPADAERPFLERMTGPAGARLDGEARGEVIALPESRSIARAVPFARPTTPRGDAAA